jgi:transposase
VPPNIHEPIIGLPGYKLVSYEGHKSVYFNVELIAKAQCPYCDGHDLRTKDSFIRTIKHHSIGIQKTYLRIKAHKFCCRSCGKYFNQRLPGVRPRFRSSEPFREEVAVKHKHGICKSVLGQFLDLGTATVERCFQGYLKQENKEFSNAACPKILGIDDKNFSRKLGFMTTFADLKKHRLYDVQLGRSEPSLRRFLKKIPNRQNCKVVLMDLSETYRSIAKKYFTNAMIVADRFHVIRLINHHFLKVWGLLDEAGRKNRGLLSLMRRHPWNLKPEQEVKLRKYLKQNPALEAVYDFKQELTRMMLYRVYSKPEAKRMIPKFLDAIRALKESGFRNFVILGETLESWQEEIVRMWRFKKTNSIVEGMHTRMEELIRRAYGFRKFENFRLRARLYLG